MDRERRRTARGAALALTVLAILGMSGGSSVAAGLSGFTLNDLPMAVHAEPGSSPDRAGSTDSPASPAGSVALTSGEGRSSQISREGLPSKGGVGGGTGPTGSAFGAAPPPNPAPGEGSLPPGEGLYPGEPGVIGEVNASQDCPYSPTYDPSDGLVYVLDACAGSDTVSILQGESLVGSVPVVGSDTAVYDPADGYLYVFGIGPNATVFQGTSVLTNFTVGDPTSAAVAAVYDPTNEAVYVVDESGPTAGLTEVQGTAVVGFVNLSVESPTSAYVNPSTGDVYVLDGAPVGGVWEVPIVSGTTVVGALTVAGAPQAVVYDPADGEVYVGQYSLLTPTDEITVFSGDTPVANLSEFNDPSGLAYDAADGDVYVLDSGLYTVSVWNGTTELANVSIGSSPVDLAVDPVTGSVYVSWGLYGMTPSGVFGGLSVFAGTAEVVNISFPDDGQTNWGYPGNLTYDAGTGDFYLGQAYTWDVAIIGPSYNVTFDESGLPDGYNWSVTTEPQGTTSALFAPGNTSVSDGVSLVLGNGTYAFLANGTYGYVLDGVAMPGALTVAGTPLLINLPFHPGHTVDVTFNATFPASFYTTYAGLFLPGQLCVGLLGFECSPGVEASANYYNVTFYNLSPGRYPYAVLPLIDSVTGVVDLVAAHPLGNVTLGRYNVLVRVALEFDLFPVTFVEQGLPPGAHWSIDVNDFSLVTDAGPSWVASAVTPHDSITFELPSGLGYFGWGEDLLGASATGTPAFLTNAEFSLATDTGSQTFFVAFTENYNPVVFNAVGLPPDTPWTVSVSSNAGWWHGATFVHSELATSSGAPSLTVELPAGTYRYVAAVAGGLAGSGSPTSFQVQTLDPPPPITVTWYAVTFTESGLAPGTNWCILVGKVSLCSSTPTLVVYTGNGMLYYRIGAVPGYFGVGPAARVPVHGAGASVAITFKAGHPAVLFSPRGDPSATSVLTPRAT